jgi:hypothetical protein
MPLEERGQVSRALCHYVPRAGSFVLFIRLLMVIAYPGILSLCFLAFVKAPVSVPAW